MGVVYKLIPEVSSFIIEQKQNDPKITCQNLAGQVFLRFGHQVSKSSVHELLKKSHVITPRERKIKEKFKIPLEKKFEISKALAPFKIILPPAVVVKEPEAQIQKRKNVSNAGEIFLKAALWDLSFKPILGIDDCLQIKIAAENNVNSEWEYLTQQVYAIKIETEENVFYVDPRFQGLYSQNPNEESLTAPIERASCEVADYILNNTSPLIIREKNNNCSKAILESFVAAFENVPHKRINKISLIGPKDRVFFEFTALLSHKREFILRVKEDEKLLTNIESIGYEEIAKKYLNRHPLLTYPFSLPVKVSYKEGADQAQRLKDHLRGRAQMFFPDRISEESLDRIISLSGEEALNDQYREIYLNLPGNFEEIKVLRAAAQNINNLAIKDYRAKEIRVFIN